MTTKAQIESNRRNARLSTGPKTEQGKEQSRRNSLKNGLTGAGVVLLPGDEVERERRMECYQRLHEPRDEAEEQMLRYLVVSTLRMDRGYQEEVEIRRKQAFVASDCWKEEREAELAKSAAELSRRPAVVSKQLRRTLFGCQWLHERWGFLLDQLNRRGEWNARERSLALDLLGVAPDFREDCRTPLDPSDSGDVREFHKSIAEAQRADLQRLIDGPMGELDRLERERVANDLASSDNPKIGRLMKLQAKAFADFMRLRENFAQARAQACDEDEEYDEDWDEFDIEPSSRRGWSVVDEIEEICKREETTRLASASAACVSEPEKDRPRPSENRAERKRAKRLESLMLREQASEQISSTTSDEYQTSLEDCDEMRKSG